MSDHCDFANIFYAMPCYALQCVRNIEPFAAALNLHANLDYMENLWDKVNVM